MKPEPMKFQTPLYSAADIRRQEQACAGQPLMELAGCDEACAKRLLAKCGGDEWEAMDYYAEHGDPGA